jgi:hypothetical protein
VSIKLSRRQGSDARIETLEGTMKQLLTRQFALLATLSALTLMAGGCASGTFNRVALNQTDHPAVLSTLGPQAQQVKGGLTSETQTGWPTVIEIVHVAVPEGGLAEWKLQVVGRVVHLLAFQTLSVDVTYEGPINQALEDRLRNNDPKQENEFLAELVRFVQTTTERSLPTPWTDVDALRQDKYRSRMFGLFRATLQKLEGDGSVRTGRYQVTVDGGGASLRLRYLGSGMYRIETHGSAALAPSPVL